MGATKSKGTRASTSSNAQMMARRRLVLERKATKRNVLAFCEREHLRLFGRQWDGDDDDYAVSRGERRVIAASGKTYKLSLRVAPRRRLPDDPEEAALMAAMSSDDHDSWPDVLAGGHAQVKDALDRIRRAARTLVHLRSKWASVGRHEGDAEEILYPELVAILGALPDALTDPSPPPWSKKPVPSLRAAIARNAPGHYGLRLTPHMLAVISLLCENGWRDDVSPRRQRTVRDVLAREAEAMRKARDRLLGH